MACVGLSGAFIAFAPNGSSRQLNLTLHWCCSMQRLLPRRNRVSLKYVFDREAGDKKFYIHSGGTQLDIVVREVAAPKLAVQGCRVVKKNVVEVDIVALIGCCHSSLRVKCQSDASFHRLQELVFAALVRLHDNVSRNAIVIYSNVSCCFSTPVKDLMAHIV